MTSLYKIIVKVLYYWDHYFLQTDSIHDSMENEAANENEWLEQEGVMFNIDFEKDCYGYSIVICSLLFIIFLLLILVFPK